MFEDFFKYKKNCITAALLISYAFIHIQLTGVLSELTFESMVDFSARLPFGQRLLVPLLIHYFQYLFPLRLDYWFFLMECLFTVLLYLSLYQLMRYEFEIKYAQALSWLFILLLPLVTIINYRFTHMGLAPVYYPYDTPTLFFMALGFLLCLRCQWRYFIPLVFAATINRESSLLLIFLIPALHWEKLRSIFKPMILSCIVYLLARWLVFSVLIGAKGSWMEWYANISHLTHFDINLRWLFEEQNWLLFLFSFAGLPLFWYAFYDYIPTAYKPIRYVALFYFLVLLLVGNFFESRIFGEIVILLYLPVCLALNNWLRDQKPILPAPNAGTLYYVNRYAVMTVLLLIVIFRAQLSVVIEHAVTTWLI